MKSVCDPATHPSCRFGSLKTVWQSNETMILDIIETGVRTLSGLIRVYVRADVEWEVL